MAGTRFCIYDKLFGRQAAVFGALKKMYGGHTNCGHPQSKRNEIASRVICYNIEAWRAKVKDGRLTHQMLKAIA